MPPWLACSWNADCYLPYKFSLIEGSECLFVEHVPQVMEHAWYLHAMHVMFTLI